MFSKVIFLETSPEYCSDMGMSSGVEGSNCIKSKTFFLPSSFCFFSQILTKYFRRHPIQIHEQLLKVMQPPSFLFLSSSSFFLASSSPAKQGRNYFVWVKKWEMVNLQPMIQVVWNGINRIIHPMFPISKFVQAGDISYRACFLFKAA